VCQQSMCDSSETTAPYFVDSACNGDTAPEVTEGYFKVSEGACNRFCPLESFASNVTCNCGYFVTSTSGSDDDNNGGGGGSDGNNVTDICILLALAIAQ